MKLLQRVAWPSRTEAFARSHLLVGRVAAALYAVHEGIWLGVLDRGLLNDLTQRHYETYRLYGTRDYNLSGLRSWERSVVDR